MTAADRAPDESPATGGGTASRRAYLLMVAAGSFATTFAQQRALGNYPILFHLKEHLQFGKEQVSEFFMWATFAWNLKPLAGVVTDAFPIRGSRRRVYMLLGGLLAALSWAALDMARATYGAFLAASIALNVGLVFASTAMGGLQVEAGQLFGLSGRVTSLRQGVMSIAQIATPLLGGVLAERAFGLTAGIGAAVMFGWRRWRSGRSARPRSPGSPASPRPNPGHVTGRRPRSGPGSPCWRLRAPPACWCGAC